MARRRNTFQAPRVTDPVTALRASQAASVGGIAAKGSKVDRSGRIGPDLGAEFYQDDRGTWHLRADGITLEITPGSPARVALRRGDDSIRVVRGGIIARPTMAQIATDDETDLDGATLLEVLERIQTNKASTVYVDAGDAAVLAAIVTDHGALGGLADDDHPQYAIIDGSRPYISSLDMGGQAIEDVLAIQFTDLSSAVKSTDSRLTDSRAPSGAAGGALGGTYPNPTVDHGSAGGLGDDDHAQYHNDARGDARYHQLGVSSIEHVFSALTSSGATWTNMPAALTFFGGSARHVRKRDLSWATEARLVVHKAATAAVAGAKLSVYFRSAYSATASDYAIAGTSAIEVAVDVVDTPVESAWVPLAAGAKADVYLALMGEGGDGVVDPTFGALALEIR